MSDVTLAGPTIDVDRGPRRPWWRKLLDAVFGYDFFISYCWDDGGVYATNLALRLRAEGYEVFLDRNDFAEGDNWKIVGEWALRRTGELIFVASPEALTSHPVIAEVGEFGATGRRIVPIDFDGSLGKLPANSPIARYLPSDVIAIRERAAALGRGPSDEALTSLRKTFGLVRQDKKRMWAFAAVAFTLGILATAAAWEAHSAIRAGDAASVALSRVLAEKAEALAESGDGTSAAQVAMEGLIDGRTGRARPFVPEALRALYHGFFSRREIAILASHSKPLNTIAISPDGETLAVGSIDGTVRVLTFAGAVICKFEHGTKITSLAFSPDDGRILSASDGAGAQQWSLKDVDNGRPKPVGSLMTHDRGVLHAAYSPDGSRIVTAGADGSAKLWDADGSLLATMAGHLGPVNDANFSPDGQYIVTASDDRSVRVWKAGDGSFVKALNGHGKRVRAASFDAKSLHIVSASDDKTARLWELNGDRYQKLEQDDHVFGASFSPDGSRILTFSEDATAKLWNTDIDKIQLIGRPMKHDGWVMSAVFNAKGGHQSKIITASKDGKARLWDGMTGDLIAVLNGYQAWETNLIASFDRSGDRVVTASDDGTARLWSATAGVEVTVLRSCDREPPGDPAAVTGAESATHLLSAVFNNDGSLIATGDTDGTARIWNGNTGCPERTIDVGAAVWSVAFSPDGKMLATASDFATASKIGRVQFWDPLTGIQLGATFRLAHAIRTVNFSRDGGRIVFGGHDGTAQIFDIVTGEAVGNPLEHDGWVQSANFGPRDQLIITASKDGKIRVRDGASLTTLQHNRARVFSAGFDSTGDRIVSASEDGSVVIWEKTPDRFKDRLLAKQNKPVWTAVFSPRSPGNPADRWVLTASFDNTARLYDASSGKLLAVLAGHTAGVRSAMFSRDGSHVVTASDDGTARIWPIFQSKEELIRRVGETMPRCLGENERKELSLDPTPPVWCRTGFGLEQEKDQPKWKPIWPYSRAANGGR